MTNTKSKKILMCRPDHFSVEYVINPWMKPGEVNQARALRQWLELRQTYEELGVGVDVIPQAAHLPDMVFTRDQGMALDGKVLLSNFRYPQRQGETPLYEEWFKANGLAVQRFSEDSFFEGGDCLPWQDVYLMGTGFRADKEVCQKVADVLGKKVLGLELVDERFYHLDTCFFPLNQTTAFYYPPAFSVQSQKILQQLVPTLIPFSQAEALGFAANSYVVNRHVLTQVGNPEFVENLEDLGYTPIELDMGEFVKSGGGIHCLTFELT